MARLSGVHKRKRDDDSDASPSSDNASEQHEAKQQQPQEQAPPAKKRGRPRKSTESEAPPSATKPTGKGKRKPGRPSIGAQRGRGAGAAGRGVGAKKAGGKRVSDTRQGKDAEGDDGVEQQQQQQQPRKKKKQPGRPSLRDLAPGEAQNQSTRASRSGKWRKSLDKEVDVGDETTTAQQNQSKLKRTRGRTSTEAPSKSTPPRRRRSSTQNEPDGRADAEEVEDDLPSPVKPYPHIASSIRRVQQSTIDEKWSPLANPSVTVATTILQLAHRPTLQRMSDTEKRRDHTATALRLVTKRVIRKVNKGLPFPPASMAPTTRGGGAEADGRETELDFEAVLDARTALERQLDPALDAVEVLRREKERIEGELERDYETLRSLEGGARAQMRQQRALLKKAHVLVPQSADGTKSSGAEPAFTRVDEAERINPFKNIDDDEIQSLATQLGGHVDSIRANLQQADGLVPQFARSRAALQDVLLGHLGEDKYEQVLFG